MSFCLYLELILMANGKVDYNY